jgi:hypothetical protein
MDKLLHIAKWFLILFAAGQATSAAEFYFQYSLFCTTVAKLYKLFGKTAPAKIIAGE